MRWGDDGFRYDVLLTRARAILAAAVSEKPFARHPWMEHEWKPISDAANRIFSLFVQAKSLAEGNPAAPRLPKFKIEGEYRGLADGKKHPLSFVRFDRSDEWQDEFDKKSKPRKTIHIPIVDWREGIEATDDACLILKVFAAGEGHPAELFEFLEREMRAQLSFSILPPNAFERIDMHRTLGLTAHELLWDLRVRFTDFLRRFLACYRPDLHETDRLTPDPLTVFFVRARRHHAFETSFHTRSGLFGHEYFLDDGQKVFLAEQGKYDAALPTEAICNESLPFPDGLCASVYLTARSSAPTHIGDILKGYRAIANDGELKKLESTLLRNRTLMEIPIYDDLPMLSNVAADGPSLILCIAIPNPPAAPKQKMVGGPEYSEFLKPVERSNYQLTEEQLVREMAQRMTRRFLSPVVSSEVRDSIGISPAMTKVKYEIEMIAPTKTPIILLGETGTGKTELATLIHRLSRRTGRFETCDKAGDPLFEDALKGHVDGAFTGATKKVLGYLDLANNGTLLIDDIDRLPLEHQGMLLRVMDGEMTRFKPVGGNTESCVDVRFLVATNENLRERVRTGKFRADLYQRLNGHTIELPPLRERRQDIPIWADYLLRRISNNTGRTVALTTPAMELLMAHEWLGNVRQLNMTLKNTVTFCTTCEIGAHDIRFSEPSPQTSGGDSGPAEGSDVLSVLRGLPGETAEEKAQEALLTLVAAGVPRRKQ